MGGVWLIFGAELRRRWRSWLVLAVLVAAVGGFTFAAIAAGYRTASAFPRFVSTYGSDVAAYNPRSGPALVKLPEVASATRFESPLTGQPSCSCGVHIPAQDFGVVEMAPHAMRRTLKLVSGRWPDHTKPDETLATFPLAQKLGVHIGTVIHVPFYAASQADAANAGGPLPTPKGPTVRLRVVGIEAAEVDFPSGSTPSYGLYGSPSLGEHLAQKLASNTIYLIRLVHGAADLPRFNADAQPVVAGTSNLDAAVDTINASIHPQAVGWWALAVLAALAGIALIGQAIGRQTTLESDGYGTLRVLGLSRRQLVVLISVRNLAIALLGTMGAVAIALLLSPLTPLGEARVAEPSTGFAVSPTVFSLGAAAVVLIVVLLGTWPAVRAARMPFVEGDGAVARPSWVVSRLSALGAPPSAVIGVRHALERGRGAVSVPVVTALLGTCLAVLALSATAVFGASLNQLVSTPRLYGDDFQAVFSPDSSQPLPATLLPALRADPAINGITEGVGSEVTINKVSVAVIAMASVRGPLLLSTTTGSAPKRDDEIGLGATTMRQVGARVGSIVPVTVQLPAGGTRTLAFRVDSQVSFPADFGNGGLGTGAVFSLRGYVDAVCPPGPSRASCRGVVRQGLPLNLLASAVPGPAGKAAIAHFARAYAAVTQFPVVPTSLVSFGEAVNFPLILGIALVAFGAATLVHLLVVSVLRRRREAWLLKAIGFVRSQIGAAVCWQATTVSLVGLIVGIPLGVVVGRVVWRAFASNLGVVPVAHVPLLLLVGLAAGVLVTANLLAIAPALRAARRGTAAELLRVQ